MAERRPLTEGLKSLPEVVPALEEQFVYGKKTPSEPRAARQETHQPNLSPAAPQPTTVESQNRPLNPGKRVPFTTRVREDIASALKRASLERQLAGVHPNTLQEILEGALEPWLKGNGYLP